MTTSDTVSLRRCLFPFLLILALSAGLSASAAPAQTAPATRNVQLAEHAFTRGDAVPAWVDQVSDLPPPIKGGAISIRLADVQFRADAEPVVYIHRALTANEASGLAGLGQYEIEFQPEYQRVQLHSLRILRDGQEIDKLASADIRFLQRETGLDQGIYSGSITAAIVSEDVRAGDTLELSYSLIGQNPVFGGKFFEAAAWDSPSPVSLRRVTLDAPEDRPIFHRLIGGHDGELASTEQHRNGRRIVRFETRALAALLGEPYVPNDATPYRWLQFSEFNDWRDVDRWAQGLFVLPPATPALNDALREARAAATQQQSVAKVLAFVQNEIRYLSISMGENSHRPFPPAQVLQRRYGDCKDKSLLMVAMLRELGIEAQPVLVSTYYRKGLDRMLPSPILFDHAIVRARIQGKLYFFDPTRLGQYGRLDRMGQVHGNAQVLAIGAAGQGEAALETIAPDDPELVVDQRSEQVLVTQMDQPVELRAHLQFAGVGAEEMRVQIARIDKEQLRKAYERAMGRRYPELTILADPQVSDDREQNQLTIDLRYRISKFFEKDEQGWLLRYTPVNLNDLIYVPDLAKRSYPIGVPAAAAVHTYDFELTLPEQVNVNYRPDQQTIHGGAFELTSARSFTGHVAQARMRLSVTADRVAPQDAIAFTEAARKMNELLHASLVVRASAFKDAAAAPLNFKQQVQNQLDASLKASSKVLADAALTGRDASGAWCERALVQAYLGHKAEALADAGHALQRNGQAPQYLLCHGDVNFAVGNFKEAGADFAHAAALDDSDSAIYRRQALTDAYLGNVHVAREELARAVEKNGDPIARTRLAIWQAILAYPATPAAQDQALLNEQWLNAALAMFRDNQPPEQMLKLANQDGGNELDPRLVEAYFYAGKYYLLRQDKLRARVYFQHALDKGALANPYHILARLELARL